MITSAMALVIQFTVYTLDYVFLYPYMPFFNLLQSIINHLWLGMSLQDAIAAPIVFVDSENTVNFEKGFEKVTFLMFLFNFTFCKWPSNVLD